VEVPNKPSAQSRNPRVCIQSNLPQVVQWRGVGQWLWSVLPHCTAWTADTALLGRREFLATDPEARVRFPALPEKKVVLLERGPLSLVSTTEELLDRKIAAPV
jgi:hypothetical protein